MSRLLRLPFVTLFLACLVPALILCSLGLAVSSPATYAHKTVIYSNGNVGPIFSAVEDLKLSDIRMSTSEQRFAGKNLGSFLVRSLATAFVFALMWAIVNFFYVRLKKLLKTES